MLMIPTSGCIFCAEYIINFDHSLLWEDIRQVNFMNLSASRTFHKWNYLVVGNQILDFCLK